MTARKILEAEQASLLAELVETRSARQLTSEDKVMLAYAVKLTRTPMLIKETDIDLLREKGFDDRGIHDICSITSYFNFVNRMADGLGIELENS